LRCPVCAVVNDASARICVGCKIALVHTASGQPPTSSSLPTQARESALAAVAPTESALPVGAGEAAAGQVGPGQGTESDDEARFSTGRVVLGTYTIERKLGRGGMGTVFLAVDAVSGQRVAVKVLPASLARERNVRERFIQEARALAALDHPGIVPLITFAQEGDDRFLVMKYVEGRSLEQLLRLEGVLSPSVAVTILREICEALAYAHGRGVVHRDIKPANVLLDARGHVVVVDFGIARKLEGEKRLTQTGMLMGTPQYMAPEQIEGQPVDGRCDLYACGLLLFEMLAGRPPFDGERTFDILRAHVERAVPDVRALRRAVAPQADDIADDVLVLLEHLLKKSPEERLPSGGAVVDVIEGRRPLQPGQTRVAQVGFAAPSTFPLHAPLLPPPAPAEPQVAVRSVGTSGPMQASPSASLVPKTTSSTPSLAFTATGEVDFVREARSARRRAALLVFVVVSIIVSLAVSVPVSLGVVSFAGFADGPSESPSPTPLAAQQGVDPVIRAGLLARTQMLLEKGELEDARVAVDALLELDPANAQALLLRAEVLVQGNNVPAATETLARLPEALPGELQARREALKTRLTESVAVVAAVASPPANARPRSSMAGKAADAERSKGTSTASRASAEAALRQGPARLPRPSELSPAALRVVTDASAAALQNCWVENVLSQDPAARGDLSLVVRVKNDGHVKEARVTKSAFARRAFHECVVEAVKLWKFPPFDGDEDVVLHQIAFSAAPPQ
jgi:serine/threonine protein kinase